MDLPLPEDPPHLYATAGIGMPALFHVEVGGWLDPRVSVEARAAWVLFNPVVGFGVEAAAWTSTGGPRGHALVGTVEAMVNPTLGAPRLDSGGETLAAYLGAYGGYRWISAGGFLLRVEGGVLVYAEGGVALGPNALVGVGYAG